ncbi:uncharacterized protein Cv-d [Vanessa tameamea]|uniref:Uncharacterized protein Cv-d n=1 Tax=Vanessa tameamea TaxID=334116 RepID=A0A8B8IMP1_VANTA
MISNCLLLLVGISLSSSAGVQVLFPELRQYSYILKTNVSTGTPSVDSYWTIEARLLLTVYDNYTRIRFKLEDYGTSLYSQSSGYSSYQLEEASEYFKWPWDVDYQENGFISALYVTDEPVWCTNLKRAISNNFQLRKDIGSYTNEEPCLYESCLMVYTANGNTIRKYSSYQKASVVSETSWSSVPWGGDNGRGAPENIATSERLFEFNGKRLNSLSMRGVFQYRVSGHVLGVTSELSLSYDTDSPSPSVEKLNMTRTGLQYVAGNFDDWTTGIRTVSQSELRNKTYEILLKIAKKGIDADNIVKNASVIHSLDFIHLLNTVTRLSYASLVKLFEDLVLGTSYDLETARNIFLEVLPHGRSDACARFVKYLVVEEKEKIEDATLLSLIRKLPFNVANHSQNLLEELETFTKLGLDFPSDIRHAGILSFAVLVSKTAEARKVKQDYFDNIVVKYFRMYSDCPQYLDRMVWLQGLCSLGYTAESYIRTIYADRTRNRHERLWASLACGHENRGYAALETSLPILLDEQEDIQLRIAALHDILSSGMRESDFLFIHDFIATSSSKELQRFWYTTVKSLDSNKFFSRYRNVADYVPFVAKYVRNPDTTYWATNNYIASSGELSPWVQLMSVGAEPAPSLAALTVSSGGRRPYVASIYIIAEGVASNLFKKIYKLNSKNDNVEKLVKVLEKMKVSNLKTPEEVHIDIVVKVHDKTVFATHVNQSRFESWNENDIKKSIMEFLRFGSHINQQMAYYPVQMDVYLPTELGTPIRLQSSVVTFTSVRGNITAPVEPADMLYWKNDLHIRYQATSVTSLSTSAPLLRSQHGVRLQRSLVTHLPIKFKVGVEPVEHKKITLTWPDPFAQHAGVAIHSRVQVEMDSRKGLEVVSVSSNGGEDDSGVFFDCERKMSGAEVIEKYIMSKFITYDMLPSQQSVLNSVERFMTSTGCGLVVPPTRPTLALDEVLHVAFSFKNTVEFDKMGLTLNTVLRYFKKNKDRDDEMFLKIDADTNVECVGRNVSVQSVLYVNQPFKDDPNKRFWKLCYFEDDTSHAPADQDLNTHPAAYHGRTTVTYRTSPAYEPCAAGSGDSKLTIEYRGTPKYSYGNVERYVEVDIKGERLHQFDLLPGLGLGPGTPIAQLLGTLDFINTSAIIKEKDGIASVIVNKGAEIQFESDSFAWLLDSWTSMQLMKRFGVYRQCRLQESTIQTLSGNVDQLEQLQCPERLVLADCSETPSFVILRQQNGGIIMYDGEHASYSSDTSTRSTNTALIPTDDGVKVISNSTGVTIYRRYNETVILIPSSYLPSVCGECAGSGDFNSCSI